MAECTKHSPHGSLTGLANAEAAESRRADDEQAQVAPRKDDDLLLKDLHAKLLVYKFNKSNWRGKFPRGEKEVTESHRQFLDACVEYVLDNTEFLEPEQIRALVKHP